MDIKKILCAVDLADFGEEVAAYTCTLAKATGARIIAVYVAPSLSQYVGFHVPPNTIEGFVGEIVTGAQQSMDAFVAEHFKGFDVEGRVLVGYAAEAIAKVVEDEKCNLIVMGTHGRTGLDRIIFGSVAEKIVKNSKVPVLTIRPENKPEKA